MPVTVAGTKLIDTPKWSSVHHSVCNTGNKLGLMAQVFVTNLNCPKQLASEIAVRMGWRPKACPSKPSSPLLLKQQSRPLTTFKSFHEICFFMGLSLLTPSKLQTTSKAQALQPCFDMLGGHWGDQLWMVDNTCKLTITEFKHACNSCSNHLGCRTVSKHVCGSLCPWVIPLTQAT